MKGNLMRAYEDESGERFTELVGQKMTWWQRNRVGISLTMFWTAVFVLAWAVLYFRLRQLGIW
jgi:hypothetical protein